MGCVGGWEGGIPLIELENSKISISFFWKILISDSRFSENDEADSKDCSADVFFELSMFGIFELSETNFVQNMYGFSWVTSV